MEQTEIEAAHRRTQNSRVNLFVFAERISGVVTGAAVAIIGFVIGGYLVMQGHDWAGVGFCGTTLATIVAVLVNRRAEVSRESKSPPAPKAKRPARK